MPNSNKRWWAEPFRSQFVATNYKKISGTYETIKPVSAYKMSSFICEVEEKTIRRAIELVDALESEKGTALSGAKDVLKYQLASLISPKEK